MKRATAVGWLKHDVTHRGITAWLLAGLFLAFYILLYFGYDIANFYAKNRNGQWIRKGWPALHTGLFGLIFVVVLGGGLYLYMEKKRQADEDAPKILRNTIGGLVLTVLMFFLPDLYHLLGFTGQPFTDFSKSLGLPSKWTFYGLLYTLLISVGGGYMIWKYRHNRYQVVRTSVVIFVQATFGFSIPWIMKMFEQPGYYFSYIWPLKIANFYPSTITYQFKHGLPVPIIVYSFVAGLVLAPLLGIFFGKRWYCSWVCGCGGLANTLGEPWRHLSNKSSRSWKIEKWTIHLVLVLTLLVTGIAILSGYLPSPASLKAQKLGHLVGAVEGVRTLDSQLRHLYAVLITAVLSGVVGVGLYPLGGTRIWCRYACPMAAMLGLLQKVGRYRIKVKKDMCISCGMCSKYCEMGIDVRAYAQANESFTRASCVGCGLCSEVCPRGVLRLENIWPQDPQQRSHNDPVSS